MNKNLPFKTFLQYLISNQLIDESSAKKSVEQSAIEKTTPIAYLAHKKIINSLQLSKAISYYFNLPWLDLSLVEIDKALVSLYESFIRKHRILPLSKNESTLCVAVLDPTDQSLLNELKFLTQCTLELVIVENEKLQGIIGQILTSQETAALSLIPELGFEIEDNHEEEINDAPIVRFINKVLHDAHFHQASDIHFEPYEKFLRVRFRIDGILQEIATVPLVVSQRVTSRLKILARLDISEKRIPQDGRFKMSLDSKSVDFRMNTCPTLYGEKVVIRILDSTHSTLTVKSLGLEIFQEELFLKAIHKPQGLILVTGPTGSGKTITLYTALNILNTPDINISTIEDPVEINLPGVNQLHVNPKTGLTFATGFRAFLRQDPDIIMVGEMRDYETAEIGIKAAQTGHLVFASLHTNNAVESLTRLANMGVATFNIASAISLIIAQRLARKLCAHCKINFSAPKQILLEAGFIEPELPNLTLFKAKGCEQCHQGYKGRTGIFELLPITHSISEVIMLATSASEIAKHAQLEGMKKLYACGLEKVKQGVISLDELQRVIQA